MPLVGVDEVELPAWTAVDQRVAESGLWRTIRALPASAAIVIGLAVRTSRPLTLLTGVLTVITN
ncbi:hypothetical protein ACFQ1S_37775 [Kibdelosporangium lantanae]|uniref:Uncharacterized protein n=1 Tax=Kibdelosporangium lantanae TaxID=1497396 RepID=A0ABW3MNZ7_9PSEU